MARVIALFHPQHAAPAGLAWTKRRWWRKLLATLFDPYRPERHYMRGPGPKWREKRGLANSK